MLNSVSIAGRLIRNCEYLTDVNGKAYTTGAILCSRWSDRSDLIDFILFFSDDTWARRKLRYLRKGNQIFVQGWLKIDTVKGGAKKYVVIADRVRYLSGDNQPPGPPERYEEYEHQSR